MNWSLVEKYRELLNKEISLINVRNFGEREVNFALVYPNMYNLAMSNLGFMSIYYQINTRIDSLCHRGFLPSRNNEKTFQKTRTPLFSLESQTPLKDYDILGFSISFELDYMNILKILDLSHIPLKAADRNENHPLIIAGGPCATFNPEPLTPYIDVFIIGEGEEVIHEFIEKYKKLRSAGRTQLLKELANIHGVYVPSLYKIEYFKDGTIKGIYPEGNAPKKVKKRWVKNISSIPTNSVILSSLAEFKNMFLIEVSRGCWRNCRYCMAGYSYKIPRVREVSSIIKHAQKGKELGQRVGLVGAAVSDYPYIDGLINEFINNDIKFSVSSLRADSITPSLIKGLEFSGHKTVTFAPEAGTERLRRVINKSITEDDIFKTVYLAADNNIPNIKMYFIIGLPLEEDADIYGIIDLTERILTYSDKINSGFRNITVSINPFIPKPFTPFQWCNMEDEALLVNKIKIIKKKLSKYKKIKLIWENPQWSAIQGLLSRGDRKVGNLLFEVYKYGNNLSAWKKAINELDIDTSFYLYRKRNFDEVLPWSHIDLGISNDFLKREAESALKGDLSSHCRMDKCKTCSLCSVKGEFNG
ncbi:MAG TPA: TIGR03960 family B12-binding radical SAM protein [Thermoanaerobacterales bacterium]|nr:TIGR03960 family B12-binding radical SAM protein [Thermoanaerobacterales bacterium]